jgi:hypothetical protein
MEVPKVRIALPLAAIVCFEIGAQAAEPTPMPALTLTVAPDGSDTNPGTIEAPLQTVKRARDVLRELRQKQQSPPGPIAVRLRGGVYRLEEPLEFTPEDSGAAAAPVVYEAHEDEVPILSGGRLVTGWRPHNDRLWVAEVPWIDQLDGPPCQLFVNGVRRPRARSPNLGEYFYSKRLVLTAGDSPQGIVSQPGDLTPWDPREDAVICLFHNWVNSYNRVKEIDGDGLRLIFARPAGVFFLGPSVRYYLENTFAALDAPGEWYVERDQRRLYYYPADGEDLAQAEVVAPVVRQTLVSLRGDPPAGLFVEHLTFRGVSFQHTDADLSPGYRHSVQGANTQRGAVHAAGLRNCLIEACTFTRLGEHAVSLHEGCADNTVRQCHMFDTGGGGVYLSEAVPSRTDEAGLTLRTTVENNLIHDGGSIFRAACGVFLGGGASYNRILHNEICDLSWMGIHLGWSWTGREPAHTHHNEVAFNHIHHLGNGVLNDIGGIYTLGVSPGTVLHHNHIHDVTRFERGDVGYGGWGIYLDAGSSEIRVENNVVHHTRDGGLHVHNDGYPYGNQIVNNIFAFGQDAQLIRNADRQADTFHVNLERNIVYGVKPAMFGGNNWRPESGFTSDSNCFWSAAGPPTFAGKSFAEWQQTGRDTHSIVADPKFVDVDRGDFRLAPDSPALALGFRPIDLSEVGLQGPEAWRRLPLTLRHRSFEVAAQPPPATWPLVEEFSDYEIGERPTGAVPDEGPARVLVTDADSASGRRCARFEDGSGVPSWKPHWGFWFEPPEGAIRLSFAVRNDPGQPATIEFECRDWPQADSPTYATGPHLRLMPDGRVMVPGTDAAWTVAGTYPRHEWVRIEVALRYGKDQPGQWALRLSTRDGTMLLEREGLPFRSPGFKRCNWLGLIGAEAAPAAFFLDDVRIESEPATGSP